MHIIIHERKGLVVCGDDDDDAADDDDDRNEEMQILGITLQDILDRFWNPRGRSDTVDGNTTSLLFL